MQNLSQQQKRELITEFKENHPEMSNYSISKYFREMNVSQSTVYSVINNYEERGSAERMSGSGRPAELMDEKSKRNLRKDALTQKHSQRELAQKYDISLPYCNKILQEDGIKAFKKQSAPMVSEGQKVRQKERLARLYRHLSESNSPLIIMDDESYFPLKHTKIPGNAFYYAYACGDVPDAVKWNTTQKFEHRLLMWIAISERGISKPYFCPAGSAVNQNVYAIKCVKQRLLPFIQEHHADGHYLFWSDLASAHYANSCQELFAELEINYVAKTSNPPVVPSIRPIEDFWGILKQAVYQHNWSATNHDQLKRRIKVCLAKMDILVTTQMMKNVKRNVGRASRYGISSVQH